MSLSGSDKKETKNGNNNVVQVKEVVKSFPVGDGEITILKGISFDVKKGEFVMIVGPSGNGKSTLLKLLMRRSCLGDHERFSAPGKEEEIDAVSRPGRGGPA